MRARPLLPFAAVATLALTLSATSSANPPVATAAPTPTVAPPTPTILPACTTVVANDTKNLNDKKSASVAQPNMTYVTPPPPTQYPCGKWVGDIAVSSTSTAPAGYKNSFVVDVVLDPLTWATTKAQCEAVKGTVDIYKKTGANFVRVGGGDVYAVWNATVATPYCMTAESPSFQRVNGSVPSSGTDTYRFVFPKTPPQLTGTITRSPK